MTIALGEAYGWFVVRSFPIFYIFNGVRFISALLPNGNRELLNVVWVKLNATRCYDSWC